MANAPIIEPTQSGGGTPFGIGVTVVGGVAGEVLFVSASGNVGQDSGLAFDPVNKDLTVGRDVIVGRNLTVSGTTLAVAPSGNVNANVLIGSAAASVTNLILRAANGNQELITFNSNSDKFSIINNNTNLTFYDWTNNVVLSVMYAAGGIAPTKLTTTQKNALTGVEGMVVYDTSLHKLCVYTGAGWETVTSI